MAKGTFGLAVAFVAAASASIASAQVPGLEPGARPGAAHPQPAAPRLPDAPAADMLHIPSAPERAEAQDDKTTVKITHFDIAGLEDAPDKGASRSAVEKIANDAIVANGGAFTMAQIAELADQISVFYRKKGLLYATAIVPVQDVNNGTVRVELLIGRLGNVTVEGNKRYKAGRILQPFERLKGKPIEQSGVESALVRLNGYPGLKVTGVMQPGSKVGEGDLVASVQQERPFEFSLGGDNFGRRETGEGRLRARAQWNNPLGIGDQASVYFQPSFSNLSPLPQKYAAGEYVLPLWWVGTEVKFFFRYNQFDINPIRPKGSTDKTVFDGDTHEGGAELAQHWIVGRTLNLSTYEGFTRKQADTFVNRELSFRDVLAVVHGRVEGDYTDQLLKGITGVMVEFRHGIADIAGALNSEGDPATGIDGRRVVPPDRLGDTKGFAGGDFRSVSASIYRFQSLQPLADALQSSFFEPMKSHRLLFRVEGQWSDSLLVPLEQFSMGGPTNVRAYQPSEELFDRGVFGSIEYQMPVPFITNKPAFFGKNWGDLVQLAAFYDYAWGRLNDAPSSVNFPSRTLDSTGFSIEFSNPGKFMSRLTLATPVRAGVERNPRIWFECNYNF